MNIPHPNISLLFAILLFSNSSLSEESSSKPDNSKFKPVMSLNTDTLEAAINTSSEKSESTTDPAAKPPTTKPSKDEKDKVIIINDDTNYFGDKVSFSVHTDTAIQGVTKPCKLPAGQTFRALGLNEDKDLIVYTNENNIKCMTMNNGVIKKSATTIPQNTALIVDKKDLRPMNRFGLTYGALLVPYKYYVDSDDFKAASSIGPYMGYRFDPSSNWLGLGAKVVGFLGATTVEVPKDSGGTSNIFGISYGVGLIGVLKKEFQFGLVVGADRVSNSENFDNNGKAWVALALGYNFTN